MNENILKNYEEVRERIPKFWERFPNGTVITEQLSPTPMDYAMFRCTLMDGTRVIATGYALEKSGDSFINKESWLENAETSAIGRALANMGLSGFSSDKRPSREEMKKVVNAELSRSGSTPAAYYAVIAKWIKLGKLTVEQVKSEIDKFQADSWEKLTDENRKAVHDALEKLVMAKK